MSHITKLLFSMSLPILLASCGSQDGGFTGTSSSGGPSSNVISGKHFVLSFSDINPHVFDLANLVINNGVQVEVIATAGNRYDAVVTTGATIYFRTEVGLLSASSCQLDTNGSCSVTWTSLINGPDLPLDFINTITAYTLAGEDGFQDNNANGKFDAGDTLTHDYSDPFLDLSHDGSLVTYDAGIDLLILDDIYDAPNGLYDGPECAAAPPPPNCGSISAIIFDTNEMTLSY